MDDKFLTQALTNLPRVKLTDRQLFDAELILNGGFNPLIGFLTESEYNSVVETMHLPDGSLWPMPITLDISEQVVYGPGDSVVLCDQYGNPIAIMEITSRFAPDRLNEAQKVFGTTDKLHPGVRYLLEEAGPVCLGGKLTKINLPIRHDFKELRRTPQELKEMIATKGWKNVIGFQTRNPIHRAHFELIKKAAQDYGGIVLVHPTVGITKDGDIDYVTRVKAYKALRDNYFADFADLSLLPLAMRMGGPREAIWHALIRKNYGCTHFIVGRDHAGPGKDSNGKLFYEPYQAQDLAKAYESEIGLTIVPMKEVFYIEEVGGYLPQDKIEPTHTVKSISGTEFRKMLTGGADIPEWFSFPEVINELRKTAQSKINQGLTIFLTGLSGAGKSTIAHILAIKLAELQDRKITLLDGDLIREHLSRGLGFSRDDRNANVTRIGFVASEITKHGGIAICAAIAPYGLSRQSNRELINRYGSYIEVYVSTPIAVCEQRDVKGLYRQARAGVLKNFTGVDDPYEEPVNPEVEVDAANFDAEIAADKIIDYLKQEGFLR